MTAASAHTSTSYRPELDGLRCLAVYLVLLFHTGMSTLDAGFIGVDLFFVLSGFLVTHVLLIEVDSDGTVRLGRFYARRARRLLPAAVVTVVSVALLALLVASQTQRADLVTHARASSLYYANWQFIADSRDYFAVDLDQSAYLHFWSLSIEEQFYVAYPLLVLAVLRRFAKHRRRALVVVLTVVVVVSLTLQALAALRDPAYAYYATETRIYQLAAGALLCVLMRGVTHRPRLHRRVGAAAAMLGVAAVVLVASTTLDMTPSLRGMLATAAAVLAIAGLTLAPKSLVGRALALPVPRYLGQISYGTYLWHWPAILLLGMFLDVGPAVLAVLAGTVATALAALSFQVFETPIRRASWLDAHRWPVVATGLFLSALAAVVVTQILESERWPDIALASAANDSAQILSDEALDRPLPPGLDLLDARSDRGESHPLCTPDDVGACGVVDGPGPHVLLVGDSHAQMLSPTIAALARENGWRLSTSIIGRCTWQAGLVNTVSARTTQERCTDARDTFYRDVLPRLEVDVVIATSISRSDQRWQRTLLARPGRAGETLAERLERTGDETARLIKEAGADLVIVKSILGTDGYESAGFDPLDCLARAEVVADCVVVPPLAKPLSDGLYDALDTGDDSIATVDLNPVLCPASPACAPVIDGRIVWRNGDHVTAGYLQHQRESILIRLTATGLIPEA